ncbi:DUF2927 domain-containing protein [Paracoccus aerodenitrificans]|uniref:DUF2927 domain-containing protein n=1 Tax=Paracoccus aerodenitrificans TaxID=3017781 RepID=UPI0022F136D1|nr:DUF2927 domain-containing protein [Paracoccus aerodenitrificans]WBU65100.1 DUF2927 domain-containing protein [Paracoccus aerodenitrificans]
MKLTSRTALACSPSPVPGRPGVLALLGLLAITACTNADRSETPPPQPPAPVPAIAAVPPEPRPNAALRAARAKRAAEQAEAAARAAESPASQTMHGYFDGVEDMLTARGRLRRDDGAEIQLSQDQLVSDFVKVALHDEYTRNGAQLVADPRPSKLRRWEQPVRIAVEFGESVPPATRTRDRSEVQSFAERLARLTGHDIAATPGTGNFTVMFLSEDERRRIGPRLASLVPGIPADDIEAIQSLPPQNYCTVFAYSLGSSPLYSEAVAIIRAELPPLLRSSCIHEEMAQGMGLANDSPDARPSIFNDDEEFALLTDHDELLLKMLYDPRLRPGMTAETATPIVREIAGELLE